MSDKLILENTDKAIADLLNKLPEIIQGASNQLPDVAKEMLIYGAFDAKVSIWIGAIVLFLAVCSIIRLVCADNNEGAGITAIILLIIGGLFMASGISNTYMIKHAPKLYLLEKANDYIKR